MYSDAEDRKDLARSGEKAEVLAGSVGENDHQAGLCNDIRRDGRLIGMTEFTSNILRLGLINRSWHSSRRISGRSNRPLRRIVVV